LRPTLLDPYDDDDPEPLVDADDRSAEDREYCQKAFSGASPYLVDRFVAANRRRRQNIHALRNDPSRAGEMGVVSAAGTTGKAAKISSFQTTPSFPPSNRIRGYRKSSRSSTSAVVLSKTARSTTSKTSLFSRDACDEKASVTSLGSASVAAVPELRPPGPPVDVTNPKILPFTCQYCCFEVPLELDRINMDLKDWVSHFYLDLQPYLCTFEGCGRAHKLFGVKQEWVQHELDYHRTQQTWYCANAGCDTEFATRAVFEQHLRSQHGDMVATKSPNFLDILIDTHQRVSLKPGLDSEQECALCGASYKDAPTGWKDHIAHHLEQFALLAMGEDKESDASEDEPDRVGLTEEYADEMRVMYPPKPASALNDGAVIPRSLSPLDSSGLRDFTDDSGGNSGGGKRHRDESERMWAAKVETYLTKQPEEDEPNKPETETTETAWLNVPTRNHGFVGRNDDLHRLNEFISQPGHICVVSGRGGIGKTATAVEYARRFGQQYSSVIWIEAETTGGLADKYNSIGGNLFVLGTESGQDPVSFTMAVRGKLERWDQRWLLIFDNVEAWKDISRYIPRNLPKTKGSILITTRQQSLIRAETRAMQRVLHRIELVPLTPDEGGRFLLCSTDPRVTPDAVPRHPECRLAVQIAELVERLPLALIMIAGYVKESRASLDDFVEIWEEKVAFRSKQPKRSRLIVEGALDSSIDLLWDIGISELSVPARNLLEILAFLDPENIQKDLLVQDHSEEYLEFLNATETTLYKRMIRLLSGRKLIDIKTGIDGGESYKIHRLLQQKIVLDIGAQLKFDSAMRKATRLVRKRFPESPAIQAPAPQNWKMCKEYMPHVFSLLRAYKDAQENFPKFKRSKKLAGLFYDAGFYIWDHQATGHDGLAFLDAGEDILDKLGVDEMAERRADIHCISGLLRNAMGCQQRVESLQRLKRALHIRKHIYDAQMDTYSRTRDVLLQNAATDYGILLLNRYDFLEAEEIFESCLRRYRVWGAEEEIPFEYSKYYYNMGIVRMWQEKPDESIQFLRHSVELVEAAFGKEGQYWDNYFMLACFIRQSGDMQTSLDMHLEILKARLDQVGKHSKSTILSTYAVGVMYANIGDLPTAM
jgi:tetratricopeptide (TPR) repeat protein